MDIDDPDEEMGGMHHVAAGCSYDSTPPSTQPSSSSRPGAKPAAPPSGGAEPPAQRNPGGGGGRYKECLKNHAVGIGGHAIDGCGEFMPAGEEGSLDALKCAACGCHRNFHRKEPDGAGAAQLGLAGIPPEAASAHHHVPHFSPYYRSAVAAPGGYHVPSHHHSPRALPPPQPLALPSTSGGGGSRDEQEDVSNPGSGGGGPGGSSSSGRKRFRTKFTAEQKDGMLAFAERVGWRVQKQDEAAVQQFCADVGVKRHVLKVWMHNNKHTLGKKP